MKTLTVELPDEVYERAERRASELGSSLSLEVAEILAHYGNGANEPALAAARVRMKELFQTVRGFRLETKIPREELYERGSLH